MVNYNILNTTSNSFVSISCNLDASINSGAVYVSTSDSLNIISLNTNTVTDYYTTTVKGKANETISSSDSIVDTNIISGT